LSESERDYYEAQIFADTFISNYIEMSVSTDENMKSASPEYPGRFQKVRRALVTVPGGKYASAFVRFFEALFRNEQTSYKAGFWSMLDRTLPLFPDLFHNFVRNLRTLPYSISIAWVTSYYIWQIHTPYSIWLFFITFGFFSSAFVELNNRIQKNLDKKPMGDVPSKLFYSFIHSNLTNPEIMVLQAYAEPISKGFDGYVKEPLYDAAAGCKDLLVGPAKKP
jgi:hypothetical protein